MGLVAADSWEKQECVCLAQTDNVTGLICGFNQHGPSKATRIKSKKR